MLVDYLHEDVHDEEEEHYEDDEVDDEDRISMRRMDED